MSDKLPHEELDQIFLRVMAEAGYLDGPLTADVWKDVRLEAFKLMVTHILWDKDSRPDVDDVGSGLAKIAAAMADRNLIEEATLSESSKRWIEKRRKGEI